MSHEIRRRERSLAKLVAAVSGAYAIACVPAILILERLERSQAVFHLTQLAAIVVCVPASITYLVIHRDQPWSVFDYLAIAVSFAGLGWILFVLVALFSSIG